VRAQLAPHEIFIWSIQPETVTLTIRNDRDEPVQIYQGKKFLVTVAALSTQTLSQISEGDIDLDAFGEKSREIIKCHLKVLPDTPLMWIIPGLHGRLIVENRLKLKVMVYMDSRFIGEAYSNETETFDNIQSGQKNIVAYDEAGYMYRTSATIEHGKTYRWKIDMKTGSLRVLNHAREPVEVQLDGQKDRYPIELNKDKVFDKLQPGLTTVRGFGKITGIKYEAKVYIVPEEKKLWEIKPKIGSVIVVNHLEEPIMFGIEGSDLFVVEARNKSAFNELPIGDHKVFARIPSSNQIIEKRIDISADKQIQWNITPPYGSLVVENHTNEPIALYLDDKTYGILVSEERKAFPDILPRTYQLRAIGEKTHSVYSTMRTFEMNTVEKWLIEPAEGILNVTNETGESIRLGVDMKHEYTLPADSAHVVQIPIDVGSHKLTITGEKTLASFEDDVTITQNKIYDYPVKGFFARLTCRNNTGFGYRLLHNGMFLGEIATGETREFTQVAVGNGIIEAIPSDSSGQKMSYQNFFRPGQTYEWVLENIPR
jgi:hypothetical protein